MFNLNSMQFNLNLSKTTTYFSLPREGRKDAKEARLSKEGRVAKERRIVTDGKVGKGLKESRSELRGKERRARRKEKEGVKVLPVTQIKIQRYKDIRVRSKASL